MTTTDLPQIIELLGYGFAIGAGGGVGAFIMALVVNTFFVTADS